MFSFVDTLQNNHYLFYPIVNDPILNEAIIAFVIFTNIFIKITEIYKLIKVNKILRKYNMDTLSQDNVNGANPSSLSITIKWSEKTCIKKDLYLISLWMRKNKHAYWVKKRRLKKVAYAYHTLRKAYGKYMRQLAYDEQKKYRSSYTVPEITLENDTEWKSIEKMNDFDFIRYNNMFTVNVEESSNGDYFIVATKNGRLYSFSNKRKLEKRGWFYK